MWIFDFYYRAASNCGAAKEDIARSFNRLFGTFQGHRIYASRKVAEKLKKQTHDAADLYNVDVRRPAMEFMILRIFHT
jgi:hypothetical protein